MKTERLQLRVTPKCKKMLMEISVLNCRTISDQIEYWARKELIKLEDEINEEIRKEEGEL